MAVGGERAPSKVEPVVYEALCHDGVYRYFAFVGGKLTDLAPWGNRLPA